MPSETAEVADVVQTIQQQASASGRAALSDLPYDLIRMLCAAMPAADIVHMMTTCRALYNYISDEAIWRELCGLYGVENTDDLGGGSFFRVYSCVLHPYGPLLGLWANDRPYTGGIIEFRLDREKKCIMGEWWFYRYSSDMPRPILPDYYAFMTIALPPLYSATPNEAVLSWLTVPDRNRHGAYFAHATDALHVPTLHVLSETDQTVYIRHWTDFSQHPDFPTPSLDAWYDRERGLPRLKVEPSPVQTGRSHENFGILARTHSQHGMFSYSVAGPTKKPAALCILPADGQISDPLCSQDRYTHVQDFRNIGIERGRDKFSKRYYPVRSDVREGQSPADEKWDPASLEGLWQGAYGAHGTELLWLTYEPACRSVHAIKVTGDENVPRGVVSWSIDLSSSVQLQKIPHGIGLKDLKPPRMYSGEGTICARGYIDGLQQTIQNIVAITSEDEIRICWLQLDPDYIPSYKRYKPRVIDTEVTLEDGLLRRPAQEWHPDDPLHAPEWED